jgi:hypothetical protein
MKILTKNKTAFRTFRVGKSLKDVRAKLAIKSKGPEVSLINWRVDRITISLFYK